MASLSEIALFTELLEAQTHVLVTEMEKLFSMWGSNWDNRALHVASFTVMVEDDAAPPRMHLWPSSSCRSRGSTSSTRCSTLSTATPKSSRKPRSTASPSTATQRSSRRPRSTASLSTQSSRPSTRHRSSSSPRRSISLPRPSPWASPCRRRSTATPLVAEADPSVSHAVVLLLDLGFNTPDAGAAYAELGRTFSGRQAQARELLDQVLT